MRLHTRPAPLLLTLATEYFVAVVAKVQTIMLAMLMLVSVLVVHCVTSFAKHCCQVASRSDIARKTPRPEDPKPESRPGIPLAAQ